MKANEAWGSLHQQSHPHAHPQSGARRSISWAVAPAAGAGELAGREHGPGPWGTRVATRQLLGRLSWHF